jgi:DNA primase
VSKFTQDSIDELKQAIDMADLVGQRTDLRRSGPNHMKGLCPFHDERTPSFSVDTEKKLYFCFGCGEKGDAIGFVEQTEALDFPGAVELLADRYGVELKREREDPQAEERRRRRERLLALLERAAGFYSSYLWESEEAEGARAYLADRGLGEEVLRAFRVGYAPRSGDRVTAGARRDGFSEQEIAAAGLGGGGRGDYFRERIMFPLADARARVLGFGARAVREGQQPKYINSRENDLYRKRQQLFGIDVARSPAAKAARIVAVEGYTDVLALHEAGVPESVAIMGTALTDDQLAELGRAAPTVFLALDADSSGQEAMLKAAHAAEQREIELRVVAMPSGADPAELVAGAGAESFTQLLDGSLSVVEFEVRRELDSGDLGTPSGRDRVLARAGELIARIPDAQRATRDELVRQVADRLDVSPSDVTAQLAAGRRSGGARAEPAGGSQAPSRAPAAGNGAAPREEGRAPAPATEGAFRTERAFLILCAASADEGPAYLERIGDEHLSSEPLRHARDHLVRHFAEPLAELPDDEQVAGIVTEVAMRAEGERSSGPELRMGFLQLDLRRIERALRQATRDGDLERQGALAVERQRVRREMDEAMGETG